MPHTIVTETCEGVADCVDACPVACIHEGPGKTPKDITGTGLILLPVLTVVYVYKYARSKEQLWQKKDQSYKNSQLTVQLTLNSREALTRRITKRSP